MKNSKQAFRIRQYYRFHARVYDATRWIFLFGRDKILSHPELSLVNRESHPIIIEAGCGTGRNLARMGNIYPKAQLVGIDVSPDMLVRAKHATKQFGTRIQLIQQPYDLAYNPEKHQHARLLLFSYALSMFNPGWEEALERGSLDLDDNGQIAVVDFHRSKFNWFIRWMGFNHVRMDGHLYKALHEQFDPVYTGTYRAMGGLWEYFIFIGNRKALEAIAVKFPQGLTDSTQD